MPTLVKLPTPIVEMCPQPNVVAILEETLEMARKGEIDGVVLILSHTDGDTSDRWALGANFFWMKMLGAAEAWKHRYIRRYDEN